MSDRQMWETEVSHKELNKYRHIRGSDKSVVEQKALAQQQAWDAMWAKQQAAERKRKEHEEKLKSKDEKRTLANIKTKEAEKAINQLEQLLLHTLSINDAIEWDNLLDRKAYPEQKPIKPAFIHVHNEPHLSDSKYQPPINILDKCFHKLRIKKEENAERLFLSDHANWIKDKTTAAIQNEQLTSSYAKSIDKWELAKKLYEENQQNANNKILEKKNEYYKKDSGAIIDYCEMVLTNSQYPNSFPQEWNLEYHADSQTLIIDYSLPDIDALPTVKSVNYSASKDEFSEIHLSSRTINELYDNILYQISLRTIHEMYKSDVIDALKSIVFNGWVNSTDKGTGNKVNACIMSVQASRSEFLKINLEKVDPKTCFKQLKGLGSSKLHGMSPIAPIISINKQDHRFVSAYDVADTIDEADNLAAMDWLDFENLIREIFEKEFSVSGGEVKITQASRDGGVDAIAFDPDPIRGGKIVIQAKRYTNVVGVSAVRDLYGTTINEGATKGILITTADYGPDAYEFAKGKPITLLNGGNLLHLLAKHGHKAKIDLKEAKKILADQKIEDSHENFGIKFP